MLTCYHKNCQIFWGFLKTSCFGQPISRVIWWLIVHAVCVDGLDLAGLDLLVTSWLVVASIFSVSQPFLQKHVPTAPPPYLPVRIVLIIWEWVCRMCSELWSNQFPASDEMIVLVMFFPVPVIKIQLSSQGPISAEWFLFDNFTMKVWLVKWPSVWLFPKLKKNYLFDKDFVLSQYSIWEGWKLLCKLFHNFLAL